MTRSRKKHPYTLNVVCKSQKWGKQKNNRLFRRVSRTNLKDFKELPISPRELMDSWDLGGDGKSYWGSDMEGYHRIIRK